MSKNEVVLSSKGQLVIPQGLREEFGLSAGSRLLIFPSNNKIIVMPKPKDPLAAMIAIGSKLRINSDDYLRERKLDKQHEEERDRTRYNHAR